MSKKEKTDLETMIASLASEVRSLEELSAAVLKLKKKVLEGMLQGEMTDHMWV